MSYIARIVSIHAPVKGATITANFSRRVSGFNPRAREGRDIEVKAAACPIPFQSTRP